MSIQYLFVTLTFQNLKEMRRLLYLTIILSLTATPAVAQKRAKKAKKTIEKVDFEAETEKLLRAYNIDGATKMLDRWEEWLDDTDNDYPAAYENMRSRALNTRNLLERVEKIELIDTLLVDSADFFTNYMLSPSAGNLLDALALPEEYASQQPKVVFAPQNGKERVWAMPSASKGSGIVVSQVLDDGTMTPPQSIGEAINEVGSTDYPFIQDDGMTIYFAAKGEESVGGYDIFMTRRSADGEIMNPQNIGMPYNSPFNDYMMVIDDARDLGWWASDRSGIPGKVTIYVFQPSTMRVNYEPDNEYIIDHALLRGEPTSGGLEALLTDKVEESELDDERFAMPIGNGTVYTTLSDFKNASARKTMEELLSEQQKMEQMKSELNQMRIAYGKGDKKKDKEIRDMEKRLEESAATVRRLSNRVVSAEVRD